MGRLKELYTELEDFEDWYSKASLVKLEGNEGCRLPGGSRFSDEKYWLWVGWKAAKGFE